MASRVTHRAANAGLAYFAAVFAAGFAIGVLRVLVVMPRLGETVSVMLELPIMLAISWWICRRFITRLGVSSALSARVVMGGVALAFLLVAEFGVSMLAFGRALADHLAHYRELPTLLGLAGQIAFAVFPVIQR